MCGMQVAITKGMADEAVNMVKRTGRDMEIRNTKFKEWAMQRKGEGSQTGNERVEKVK